MKLLVFGISYKTAPISLRERVIFSPENINIALNNLLKKSDILGGVILSTCNRTEVYLSIKNFYKAKKIIILWLYKFFNDLKIKEIKNNFYSYIDNYAVSHLMRVTSGLDSMILGEHQILSQVKSAFFRSLKNKNISIDLQKLFESAFSVAKKIRSETKIGSYSISIPYIICVLLKKIFISFTEIKVMLIGSGTINELIAKQLFKYKIKDLFISNRTIDHAKNLAIKVNGCVVEFNEIFKNLNKMQVIITSTYSRKLIITYKIIKSIIEKNKNKKIIFIDISIPRNIDKKIKKITGVHLYTLEDLKDLITNNLEKRKNAATLAENIIKKESIKFMSHIKGYYSSEIIKKYRFQINKLKKIYEKKALLELKLGNNPENIIKKLTYKLTNRLVHKPTKLLYNTSCSKNNKDLYDLYNKLKIDL
ncbi:hemA [Wigglesworthia glossinidia endosymbiont of Glossina brevipalpis]|uniref:Glutamyl-tRNA reductase n=1 Tax=Wigglesworthia glossinidia brevipalpis TaxID=36870 RepID=HEM1_WIGBR|nr:RecName: Full=Glutamyl-tRNA reductase; Short=GluTR [Wigglesworthia glossinidia endosymbiont of Glossina brevipalpis]BAC24492.1 hemA [Wigglesworthia glossinidia endosymbiont of Glossina brevipalpis]